MTSENKRNAPRSNNKPAAKGQTRQTGYRNRDMAEKIGGLRNQIQTRGFSTRNAPAVNRLGNDGEDHINVYHHAETVVGRALAFTGDQIFSHNRYGKFRSVAGLMAYLSSESQPDIFRTLPGSQVFAERHRHRNDAKIYNYRWVAADATWQKVKQNSNLAKALYDSDLPFDVYRTERLDGDERSTIRVRHSSEYEWLVPTLEEIRRALREAREPDFSQFIVERDVEAEKIALAKEAATRAKTILAECEKRYKVRFEETNSPGIYFGKTTKSDTAAKWLAGDLSVWGDEHYAAAYSGEDHAFLTNAFNSHRRLIRRVGVLITLDTANALRSARDVFEMTHFNRKGPPSSRIFVVSSDVATSDLLEVLVKTECNEMDLMATYSLFGGRLIATVNIKPNATECGAPVPEFNRNHIPESLRDDEFTALDDGTDQYRVHKTCQIQEEISHISAGFAFENQNHRFHKEVKPILDKITRYNVVAYLINTHQITNGEYPTMKVMEIFISDSDAHDPKRMIVLMPLNAMSIERWQARNQAAIVPPDDTATEAVVEPNTANEAAETEVQTPEVFGGTDPYVYDEGTAAPAVTPATERTGSEYQDTEYVRPEPESESE